MLFAILSYGAGKENLFNHQELFQLVIISYTFMTLMFDSGVILLGEIRCLSFLGVKELTFTTTKKTDTICTN